MSKPLEGGAMTDAGEKLRDRWNKFSDEDDVTRDDEAVSFARAQLERAAGIAENEPGRIFERTHGRKIASAIRKLKE